MIHYSAGYTQTTNHFVIQNLPFFSQTVIEEEKAKFALLLRFLQRSENMPLSLELAEKFNIENNQSQNTTENYVPLLPLQISEKNKYIPKWMFEEKNKQTISEKTMTLFLRERLQNYLPEWSFLEFLFWANAPLSEVLQQNSTEIELQNTTINFYLPIAELAILIIAGSEEREQKQKIEQKLRSKGIYVINFTAEEIINETDLIREKMEWIRHQVEKPIFSNKLKEWNRTATNKPRETIIQQVWWKAALIRIQILTAELLFRGIWKINAKNDPKNNSWKAVFLMREKEQIPKEIIELAIESVQKLATQLFPTLSTQLPKISISTTFSENEADKETNKNRETLKIDFSILHRWTDLDKNKDWIKIRNEYAENYRFSFHSDEGKPLSRQIPIFSHSFFKNKSKIDSNATFHKWDFETNNDLKRSEFLLTSFSNQNPTENQSSFIQILLAKALNGQSIVANLPLEINSNCIFGWLSVLQSSPSLLVCASTDAALDKMEELAKNGIDKVAIWHSEMSSQEIEQTQNLIKKNKVFLLILTADLLNTKAFINFVSNDSDSKNKLNWAYFLVDEIHRFSEWSPQHKEEYIALERTYYNYFYNDSYKTPFVFLSHFLDKSVSKTIQNTFKIDSTNFYGAVSSSDYLENKISNFEFIETENTYSALVNLLKNIQKDELKKEKNTNTGIIFTSGVNGSTGSYLLSERLEFDLKRKVYPYSIEIPKDSHDDKETHFIKRNYLRNALKTSQDLLVASTSALSSGINLENLDFIIQYGLPQSLTELLDISNRTKKENAKTYIIFQKEKDEETLVKLFEPTTRLSDIRNMDREVSWLGGDMYRHLLEWSAKTEPVEQEVEFMKQFYDKYCLITENSTNINQNDSTIIKISEVEISDLDFRLFSQKVDRKLTVERTIIRFYQMGILSNWEYSTHISNTKYKIWVQAHDQNSVRKHIFDIIQTHQSNFEIHKDEKYSGIFSMKKYSILEKYSFLFLQWIQENSIYHLRKNLEELFEYAKKQAQTKQPIISIFAEPFLHDSSINRLLYFVEKESENESYLLSKKEIDWIFEDIEKMNAEEKTEKKTKSSLDFVEQWRQRVNQNTVLDFYKAVLELHLGIDEGNFDTENPPKTLFNSVNIITKATINNQNLDLFIKKYVSFGTALSEEAKAYLSESILKNEFGNESEDKPQINTKNKHLRATQIYSVLQDMYSLTVLLQTEVEKMEVIQFEVQGG
jgi:superfamily II DNA/RNA helicase